MNGELLTLKAGAVNYWLAFCLVLMALLSVGSVMMALVYPHEPYISVMNPHKHKFVPSKARPGDRITVHREYVVHRTVEVNITRQLEQYKDNGLVVYQLPRVDAIRQPGNYVQDRFFLVPKDIGPGLWYMRNIACYSVTSFRTRCYKTPALPLEIIDK